jgi:xanthine dehydrogenase molybdopterin-binding subunit B
MRYTDVYRCLVLQVAVAEPQEDGCLRVTSATQSLDAVQRAVAGVLGLPFNKIAVGARNGQQQQGSKLLCLVALSSVVH